MKKWNQYSANLAKTHSIIPPWIMMLLHQNMLNSSVVNTYLCTNMSYNFSRELRSVAKCNPVTSCSNQTDCLCKELFWKLDRLGLYSSADWFGGCSFQPTGLLASELHDVCAFVSVHACTREYAPLEQPTRSYYCKRESYQPPNIHSHTRTHTHTYSQSSTQRWSLGCVGYLHSLQRRLI